MQTDLDYARLKKSLEFFIEEYVPPHVMAADSHPIRLLECAEQRSMTLARRSIAVAIGDFVEATQGYSLEHVLAADSELERRGGYPLSLLRSRFSRRRNKV